MVTISLKGNILTTNSVEFHVFLTLETKTKLLHVSINDSIIIPKKISVLKGIFGFCNYRKPIPLCCKKSILFQLDEIKI